MNGSERKKSSRHPKNNKARKMDVGRSCGKKIDYTAVTEWTPRTGKRSQGRPYKIWRDEIYKYWGTPAWTEHTSSGVENTGDLANSANKLNMWRTEILKTRVIGEWKL